MYYFVVNPASGSGRGMKVWQTVKAELDRLHVHYHAHLLARPGDARRLAEGFGRVRQPITVVAVGGDGTINELISGFSSFQNITFACIPTGSGNDFVRGLGLPKEPVAALHMILERKQITKINIGTVYGSRPGQAKKHFSFAVSSGVGFDAAVCRSVQASRLKQMLNLFHFGKLIYLLTALWLLLTMKRRTLTVSIDGQPPVTYEKAYFAAAMNLRYEGGGFMFCPDALPDDDALDLFLACGISRLRVLSLLPLAFSGKHVGKHGLHIIRCRRADLVSSSDICLHTDGEVPGEYRNISFSVCENKLAVITR